MTRPMQVSWGWLPPEGTIPTEEEWVAREQELLQRMPQIAGRGYWIQKPYPYDYYNGRGLACIYQPYREKKDG